MLVGMAQNQAKVNDYEAVLRSRFKYVEQYWDSGNFKGYVASDSKKAIETFLDKVGSTQSEFTTRPLKNNIPGVVINQTSAEQELTKQTEPEGGDEVVNPVTKAELTALANKLDNGIVTRKLGIRISSPARSALKELAKAGHKVLAVGGAVRDALQGITPKDIDLEVYNITYEQLELILAKYGKTSIVGKAFGIIKFTDKYGGEYDFSVPRRESKVGTGHTGFEVQVDPTMTPREAAERRDFTWNGLAYDMTSHEIHDYFGGIQDLHDGVLRHTSPKFAEDPLRILRAMQFQGRFGFDVDPSTMELMNEMVERGDLDGMSLERTREEWMKWATKARFPGKIFGFLRGTGLINRLPHIGALKATPQDPVWHPEGDVEVHTAFVMDEAARIADREGLVGDDRAVLLFSALTHDFAKPQTTKTEEIDGKQRITSRGHEEQGGPLAKQFLDSVGVINLISEKVVPLVENHLQHVSIASIPTDKGRKSAVRKLARRLGKANINELLRLIEADTSGRPPLPKGMPEAGKVLQSIASEVHVTEAPEKAIAKGQHLIDLGLIPLGKKDGVAFKPILDAARLAQDNGEFTTEAGAIKWLENHLNPKPAEPDPVVTEEPAAETDKSLDNRIHQEAMDRMRDTLDLAKVAKEGMSVKDILTEAFERYVSKDMLSGNVIEHGIALDAMSGRALNASQQVALANVIVKYKADRDSAIAMLKSAGTGIFSDAPSLTRRIDQIDNVLDFYTEALNKAGSTAGRALFIRTKVIEFTKYDASNMVSEVNDILKGFGKTVTAEQRAELQVMSDKIKEARASHSALLSRHNESLETIKNMVAANEVKSIKKRVKPGDPLNPKVTRSKSLLNALGQLDKVLSGNIC